MDGTVTLLSPGDAVLHSRTAPPQRSMTAVFIAFFSCSQLLCVDIFAPVVLLATLPVAVSHPSVPDSCVWTHQESLAESVPMQVLPFDNPRPAQ